MNRSSPTLISATLLALWGLIIAWQTFEHHRVVGAARKALINRAVDIASSVGVVIRSQRRFGGIVTQDRLESALNDLVQSEELVGVTLLNAQNAIVAQAGTAPNQTPNQTPNQENADQPVWTSDHVTVVHPVDLGTVTNPNDLDEQRPTIVIPEAEVEERFRNLRNRSQRNRPPTPPSTRPAVSDPSEPESRARRQRDGRRRLIDADRYQQLLQTQSLHRFALVLPLLSIENAARLDFRFRFAIGALSLFALGAIGITWHNVARNAGLQLRLIRAKEMNDYLQEMNLAAAGLAHETRNPLNLIRGMAQMISQNADASGPIREQTHQITQEVDRVTTQLNDFISYSKPRETRITPVDLEQITRDVMRTLAPDLEDKSIHWQLHGPAVIVEADEQMLRQVLFNLLLNATQAVGEDGKIQITLETKNRQEAALEIQDDGPGIPPELRSEIFKPYFTSHERGTGLGLSIVHQIVLAHDWDIEYLESQLGGATFRISRLRQPKRNP